MEEEENFEDVGIYRLETELPVGPKYTVKAVEFDLGRYGKCKKTLNFDTEISVSDALEKISDYMTKKISQKEFNRLAKAGDLFPRTTFKDLESREDTLGDARFVEWFDIDEHKVLRMRIGS